MLHLMETIKTSAEYQMISTFYGDRKAVRSQVPLMNHIKEGIAVLEDIDSTVDAMLAFCIHPMLQDDIDLERNLSFVSRNTSSYVLALALEYRSVANEYLSPKVNTGHKIRLSPVKEVNDMLVADKVQNAKDFYVHHSETHSRSKELSQYFAEWFNALDITTGLYMELCAAIEGAKIYESEYNELKRKNRVYETLLHRLDLCSNAGNNDGVRELLHKISNWSYAHRSGNGELSDEEQQERIDQALDNILASL